MTSISCPVTQGVTRGQTRRARDAAEAVECIIRADQNITQLLNVIRSLGLPQWRLVAGCLYQTVWNVLTDRPRGTGIKDYDLIYYSDEDSWDAEDTVIRHVAAATRDCVGPVEARNQARVHLWFPERFGCDYPRLDDADQSLRYYASIVHAVGVRLEPDGSLDIAAPFGLDDVFAIETAGAILKNYRKPL